jgi:hypothetical protein
MSKKNRTMGLDETKPPICETKPPDADPESQESPAVPGAPLGLEPARQADVIRPVCPTHLCYMKAGSARADGTYYYCQVEDCHHSEHVPAPRHGAFREPFKCPERACLAKRQSQSYLQLKLIKQGSVTMECPHCKYQQQVPRQVKRSPPPPEDLSER